MVIAKRAHQALQDVQVGGEVKHVGDDMGTPRPQGQSGSSQFKQVNRDRIACHHLARCGAQQPANFLADPDGRFPPVFIPTANQVAAPFLLCHLLEAVQAGMGEAPE